MNLLSFVVQKSSGGLGGFDWWELEFKLLWIQAAELLEGVFAFFFPVEELLFAGGAPAEAAEFAGGGENAVAGNEDTE
jgi:hypothetical protein